MIGNTMFQTPGAVSAPVSSFASRAAMVTQVVAPAAFQRAQGPETTGRASSSFARRGLSPPPPAAAAVQRRPVGKIQQNHPVGKLGAEPARAGIVFGGGHPSVPGADAEHASAVAEVVGPAATPGAVDTDRGTYSVPANVGPDADPGAYWQAGGGGTSGGGEMVYPGQASPGAVSVANPGGSTRGTIQYTATAPDWMFLVGGGIALAAVGFAAWKSGLLKSRR